MPDHEVRLTWPEADALRTVIGRSVALLVPPGTGETGSALHVVLTGGPRPLHVTSVYVATPERDALWLDVERPRIDDDAPVGLGGEAPSHRVHIGVVREVAVLTETHVDDPPEDGSEVESSVARRWRSLRRALRTEEQRIVDDLVEDAERASAGRPIVTVVDDAFELVAERVLHVGAVGSFVHWSLDDQAEGYERHVLARQP